MLEIDLHQLEVVHGGKAVRVPNREGWSEQIKHKNGLVFRREISPKGRKYPWQPVDTFWFGDS